MLPIKKLLVFFSVLFLLINTSYAQNNNVQRQCLSSINEPIIQFRTTPYLSQAKLKQSSRTQTSNLPTIIHIIHVEDDKIGKGDNISYNQILSQVNATNRDLLYQNTNKGNTLDEFSSVSSNMKIELKLAIFDNTGKILTEPGVNRIVADPGSKGYFTNSEANAIIRQHIWDPNKYLNIWVLKLDSEWLGYAFFPNYPSLEGLDQISSSEKATSIRDGVVINTTFFGSNEFNYFSGISSPFNLGRTLTHELGHYLGVLHTWGVGSPSTQCNKDDYCGDTPKINKHHSSGNVPDLCDDGPIEFPDFLCDGEDYKSAQYQNFMDYTDDKCMTMFSDDQKARVDIILADAIQRSTLNEDAPTAPTRLTMTLEDQFFALSWNDTDVENAIGYVVERQIDQMGYEVISPVLDLNTTTYNAYFSSSEANKRFTFRVYAVNSTSFSKPTNTMAYEDGVLGNTIHKRPSFTIYPNPSEGVFIFKPVEYITQKGTLEVWSTTGRKVLSFEVTNREAEIKIDLSNHPKGTYIMKLSSEKGMFIQRCIKK